MNSGNRSVLIGTALVALAALVALRTFTSAGLLSRFAIVLATVVATRWVLERVVD